MTEACNLPEGFASGAAMKMPMDGQATSRRLAEFFEIPDDALQRMGEAGKRLVEESFTWDQVAQEMARVYRWAAGGGTPPSVIHL
jgi:poly(glycerol-phosphate) alpha-glucosyltransferase